MSTMWYPVAPLGNGFWRLAVWTFPALSVALTMILYSPMVGGFHSVAQKTHVYPERGSLTLAVSQVLPPSVLTSTFNIPRSPAKAMPAIGAMWPAQTFEAPNSTSLFLTGLSPGIAIV